jgi:hypothetical protein
LAEWKIIRPAAQKVLEHGEPRRLWKQLRTGRNMGTAAPLLLGGARAGRSGTVVIEVFMVW